MEDRKKLTLDELFETQEYQQLTPKQRLFVATYCAGGLQNKVYNPVSATLVAYKCKNPESARVMSYALMSNMRIIATLNRHFNTEPIEQFLVEVNRAVRNKRISRAQVDALKLKADILGYAVKIPGINHTSTAIPADIVAASKAKRKRGERKPAPISTPPDYSF